MIYHSEHLRLKPALTLAHKLDIATNPAPAAIFEAGSAGFQSGVPRKTTLKAGKACL